MKHPAAVVLLAWAAVTLFWCSWLIGREGPPPRKRTDWRKPRRSRLLAVWRFITLPRFDDRVMFWVCLLSVIAGVVIGAVMDWAGTDNGWE